jgi:hypothetical protein
MPNPTRSYRFSPEAVGNLKIISASFRMTDAQVVALLAAAIAPMADHLKALGLDLDQDRDVIIRRAIQELWEREVAYEEQPDRMEALERRIAALEAKQE